MTNTKLTISKAIKRNKQAINKKDDLANYLEPKEIRLQESH
jgi:hypothetical protein